MNNTISRRDFLNGTLVSAASLALFSKMGHGAPAQGLDLCDKSDRFTMCHAIWKGKTFALAEPDGRLYDCIIIGGGMSGLVAAWKLRRLGIKDVVVLEQNETMGGLCRSDKIGGITSSRASAYASFPFNGEMTALYNDLGLIRKSGNAGGFETIERFRLRPPYDQIHINNHWISEPFSDKGITSLPVSKQIRGELKALIAKLEQLWQWEDPAGRAAFDCPIEKSAPNKQMRALDAITLGEYVKSQGWSLEMIRIFDPLLRSAYGLGQDRISAWAALDLLMDELLPEDAGKGSLCFPGGNAFICENLARRIGATGLMANTFVTQVRGDKDVVRIGVIQKGRERTLRARAAIFAAPQFMAPYLIPDLPAEKKMAAKSLEYSPYVVANVAVSKTPPNLAYSNQLVGNFTLSDFIVAGWAGRTKPAGAPSNQAEVFTAYCPLTAADRMNLLTDTLDNWQGKVLGDLEKCLPGVGRTVTTFNLYRWGHAFAAPVKNGLFSETRNLLRRPFGRVFFAGADVEGIPTIDHAMASGFRTAGEVVGILTGRKR